PIHPAYIYLVDYNFGIGNFSLYCPIFFHLVVTCEYNNGVKQYWDSCMYNCMCYISSDSCYYILGGGIEEHGYDRIFLSPNPATHQLTISSRQWAIKEIEIYDVVGEKQIALPLNPLKGTSASIDVSGLAAGIYFVRVRGENKISVVKMVKE
ncbi:MAG: T9SS type A sorting domain-containing protein, partial [Bacteroidia bacterium]|nr:T9SS type A sorting domain-containing protein [Bacteroidia bacterium]